MNTRFVALVALATFIVSCVVLYNMSKPKLVRIGNFFRKRAVIASVGAAANGAQITQNIDMISEKFVYRLFVTDSGVLRTQVDAAVVPASASATVGPVAALSLTAGGANYVNGKYNNVTLTGGGGSGAQAYLEVSGKKVTVARFSAGGINYSVNDILTPYFTFQYESGTVTQSGTGCQLTVTKISNESVDNPNITNATWSAGTTVSDIGPGAVYAANESYNTINRTHMGNNYSGKYFPGICETLPDIQSRWFCAMDETAVRKDATYKNALLFKTMTILAETSEKDNFRIFYLLLTYRGLGLLAAPRGAQITVDLFATGYTDIFTELGHPRCGQSSHEYILGTGLFGGEKTDFYTYTCGLGCAIVMPFTADAYLTLVWELASPNGLFRLQFFDSGHVRFIRLNAQNQILLPAIFETLSDQPPDQLTTITTYPRCKVDEISVYQNPMKALDLRRDAWILRGISFTGDRNGEFVSAPSIDIVIQITDSGAMVLQKNYRYLQTSHLMTQQAIGKLSLSDRDPLVYPATGSSSHVGNEPTNDSLSTATGKGVHWRLANFLSCYTADEAAKFDYDNGTKLAQTAPISGGKRYILWMGFYGLRLLFAADVSVEELKDFTKCLWITPFYDRMWYYSGDKNQSLCNNATICRDGDDLPFWSLPSRVSADFVGNPYINTCGTFQKPAAATGEVQILNLRSKNKRFVFQMMSSGRCLLWDLNDRSILYSTDTYTQKADYKNCP